MIVIGFSHTQGLDCQPSSKHWPTLRRNGGGMAVLIIDGRRIGDVRVYDDGVMQTVIQRWGTGGGNIPLLAYNDSDLLNSGEAMTDTENSTDKTITVVRRLTPIECERLQGFPDDWTDGQRESPRYRQLGNAVTVNVIEWIGSRF